MASRRKFGCLGDITEDAASDGNVHGVSNVLAGKELDLR